mgnify:CR=1 FL=1
MRVTVIRNLSLTFCLTCSFVWAALAATQPVAQAAGDPRPNILWIVIEDASCHTGPYGETAIDTPNIDILSAEGVIFDAAFVTAPVCSASRSAMITGMVQSTLGVHNHRSQKDAGKGEGGPEYHDSYRLPVKLLPELFQEAGYHTSLNSGVREDGKFGKTDYNFLWHRFEYDSAHWSDCPADKPFFAQLQLKGGKNRGDNSGSVDPEKMTLPPYYPEHPVFKQDWAEYLNSWLKTDRQVGEVVQQLKDAGRFENTAIFFITDHGVSHLRGKQFVYEEGLQVPLIVRYPEGRYAGTRRDDMVMQIDLGPTSLGLAGIEVPKHMQGKDFESVDYAPRSAVFSGRDRCDETVDILRSVRTERFKYIRNFMSYVPHVQPNQYKDGKKITQTMKALHAAGELNALQARIFSPTRPTEELYDLKNDPEETVNLAADPKYAKRVEALRNRLYQNMERSRDLGLIPEPMLEELGKEYGSKYRILRQSEHGTMVRDLIAIIEAGEAGDVRMLMKGLRDEDPSVRYWAATWLGNSNRTVASRLLVAALEDEVPAVRVAAALALSQLGQPEKGIAVILATIDDENRLAGMYAIRALEWSGIRTTSAKAAVEKAKTSPYEFTRRIALRLSVQF